VGLSGRSITVREAASCDSLFPVAMSSLLCDAVAAIANEELPELMGRHESDHGNFDGKIEDTIRSMRPDQPLRANHPVCEGVKFNNDLVLETDDGLVCIEIEKSPFARFEFDILKMQAAASQWLAKRPEAKVYGAFIVPADNVVARHISGNARESSYGYLKRLARLIARIDPLILADILVVGYSTSLPEEQTPLRQSKGTKKAALDVERDSSPNVVKADAGLLPDGLVWDVLKGYPQELLAALRKQLVTACPGLREKINRNSRYLGYSNGGSDAVFVYVRKEDLLIDLKVSADLSVDLERLGFEVRPRDNFQAKSGWLTGMIVPHSIDKLADVVKLAMEALATK
jgi:hypothetical protein